MQIRQTGVQDAMIVAKQINALLDELAPNHSTDFDALVRTATTVLALPAITGFIAQDQSETLGLIMLNECAAIYAGGIFGEITELYVAPRHRSKGIAAALVAQAVEEGQMRGWARIEVGAPGQPEWARTLDFYLREGFCEIGPRLRRVL